MTFACWHGNWQPSMIAVFEAEPFLRQAVKLEINDTEVDFFEDPAFCSRYRAILRRIDKGQ